MIRQTLVDSAGVDLLVASNIQGAAYLRGQRCRRSGRLSRCRGDFSVGFSPTISCLFDSVIADIDTSSDNILERARDDYLYINAGLAQMIYGNRSVAVQGFESLNAHALMAARTPIPSIIRVYPGTDYRFTLERFLGRPK